MGLKKYRFIIIITLIASLVIPGYYLIYYYLTRHGFFYTEVLQGLFFTVLVTIGIGSANMAFVKFLQKKYPWHHHNVRRFIIELFVTSFNSAAIISIFIVVFYFFFNDFNIHGEPTTTVFFTNIIIALIVNTIAISTYEGFYMFNQWKNALIESERLRSEKAESQYAVLKNQVNPHFLFNSLNSLSSLIRVSPEKAIDFVDRFSKIYRYVLEVNDKTVVELKDELEFLQSYYFLQKIRFCKNLEIETNINATKLNEFLPPLSIQILIENAIKHNEISTENPLKIDIYLENDFLVIANNLQFKNSMESSTGIGLVNLAERYEHLTDQKPSFYATTDKYIAKIPLIKASEC